MACDTPVHIAGCDGAGIYPKAGGSRHEVGTCRHISDKRLNSDTGAVEQERTVLQCQEPIGRSKMTGSYFQIITTCMAHVELNSIEAADSAIPSNGLNIVLNKYQVAGA